VHDRCDTGYSTVTARSEYTKPYMTPYETRNLCAKFSQFHVSNGQRAGSSRSRIPICHHGKTHGHRSLASPVSESMDD
jgi:hypothetical protein